MIVLDTTVPLSSSVVPVFEATCGLASAMQISRDQAGCPPPVHNVGAWLLGKGKTPHHCACVIRKIRHRFPELSLELYRGFEHAEEFLAGLNECN